MASPGPNDVSLEEYRALSAESEVRYEYYRGEIFAMAGGTPSHAFIADNLSVSIGPRIRPHGCRTVGSDLRVRVEETDYHTYPDLSLVCGRPEFAPDDPNSLVNPVVLIEVLSPSTERQDRRFKLDQYRRIPSVRMAVLVAQDEMRVETYAPTPEGWLLRVMTAAEDALDLPIADVAVPLSEIYEGVEFSD